MMVAFYFGSRSLKYLKGDKPLSQFNTVNSQKKGLRAGSAEVPSNDVPTLAVSNANKKNEIVVIDSKNPLGDIEPGTKMPPITAIDPMA